MEYIIGIDPGKKGAIVSDSGEVLMRGLLNNRTKDYDFGGIIRCVSSSDVVVVEKVHGIYGMGAGVSFEFGRGVGILEGIIRSCVGKKVVYVSPQTWQKVCWQGVGDIMKGDKRDTKAMSMRAYINLGGDVSEKHDGVIDAFLILKWYKQWCGLQG
jgi:hypothetical protein